ncbi:MAG: ribosome hibernation-promoting factor, HPF/YfiA family [Thermodesulfobacteriota bacterium]
MNIKITTRHIDDRRTAKKMKEYMLSKLPRVGRYLHKQGEEAAVSAVLSSEKLRHTAEVNVAGTRLSATATVTSDDLSTSIDNVMDAVVKQLRRKGDKRLAARRRKAPERSVEPPSAPAVKIQKVAAKLVSPEEAVMQVQSSGKDFLVFTNSETLEMNVVYRRDKKIFRIVPR